MILIDLFTCKIISIFLRFVKFINQISVIIIIIIVPKPITVLRNGVLVTLTRGVAATPKVAKPIIVPVIDPQEVAALQSIEISLANYDTKRLVEKREYLQLLLTEACKYIGIDSSIHVTKSEKAKVNPFYYLVREEKKLADSMDLLTCPEDIVKLLHRVFSTQKRGGRTSVIPDLLREQGNLMKFLNGLKHFVQERFNKGP